MDVVGHRDGAERLHAQAVGNQPGDLDPERQAGALARELTGAALLDALECGLIGDELAQRGVRALHSREAGRRLLGLAADVLGGRLAAWHVHLIAAEDVAEEVPAGHGSKVKALTVGGVNAHAAPRWEARKALE
eukprot:CAMPEP_0171191892 /NCGR_PEP_ID=MMETSP0790-20130122/19593_1 /TAXON_ID=2925 /ORGANISM="Alexandrium catenella, Strain OF101" /LENGTH=133 /DNA_ID=CAMNT_0011657043 /DNA_START=88 /DNA_END=487 /DNA_ORIENTATION=-